MKQNKVIVSFEMDIDEHLETSEQIVDFMNTVFIQHKPLGKWSQFQIIRIANAKIIPEAIPEANQQAIPEAKGETE